MDKTIDYYNLNKDLFISSTYDANMKDIYLRFLKHLKTPSKVLDAGCGSGRDALFFLNKGYSVDAFDASIEMCKAASILLGKEVSCISFKDLAFKEEYDGIWACASLLHVAKKEQEDIWKKLKLALKENGIIYSSYKKGSFEGVRKGRFYCDYEMDEVLELIKRTGLTVIDKWFSQDVRVNNNTTWINIIAKNKLTSCKFSEKFN